MSCSGCSDVESNGETVGHREPIERRPEPIFVELEEPVGRELRHQIFVDLQKVDSEPLAHPREIQSVLGAHAEHDGFQKEILVAECLPSVDRTSFAVDLLLPVEERMLVPKTGASVEGMGRGPEAKIRGVVPVFLVVARAVRFRAGEVRDFVTLIARIGEKLVGKPEELGLSILLSLHDLPFPLPPAKECPVVNRQLVAGQMIWF